MRCLAALLCCPCCWAAHWSKFLLPWMRKCACTHACITFMYMYVCKWEKSTMGVGSCHFACPCMSVHAYNTIFHVVFLHNFHTFSYFSCSAKERDRDRRCKNILPFLAHNLLKKTFNLICCCCKWVWKYTHKMLPIYTMHTHTYRAHMCVCDCVCVCVSNYVNMCVCGCVCDVYIVPIYNNL